MGIPQISPGRLFASRFEIEKPAGQGGMSTVYRARDRYSGDLVALKVLQAEIVQAEERERFAREAQLLSELRHPGIVAHVAHGQTAEGVRFLAMEWLDGEDLRQRLLRGPLPLRDSLSLLSKIAAALLAAHDRGVIHRDLKPGNLFLVGGEIARVKILDFGIARRISAAHELTRTGTIIGTLEYMAPEQARGTRELLPAADLFSLGCVLYEVLTGQAPFVADHVAAVMVRLLFEEPVPVEKLRPGLPSSVCALIRLLLAKDPAQRLGDATRLCRELSALLELSTLGELPEPDQAVLASRPRPHAVSFAEEEQNLCSIVLAAHPDGGHLQTGERQGLLDMLAGLGVKAEFLVGGRLLVTAPATGNASDDATRAARAALLIKDRWPEAVVSMATGRGAIHGLIAVGEVVEQAVRSLAADAQSVGATSSGALVDALSARLLEGRFALTPQPNGGAILLGEDRGADANRLLLGKPTACVGRESELSILDAQLTACIEESAARVTLVTAAPGVGKSRLRHELLLRVEKRSEPVTCLLGRADMMSAGAPYGVLRDAIRNLCGISGAESIDTQQALLRARIGQHIAASDKERIVLFVGELCNVPFPDDGRPMLQAARQDPKLMPNRMRRALFDWLLAECAAAPVLLILDDLQWGDGLTVSILDELLRMEAELPLHILAFARTEIHEVFPKLWQGRRVKDLPLKGLGKKACERLIKQVLGNRVAPEVVDRVIEQSAGNALFLEELIRSIAEGNLSGQPETVLAMLQARVGRLSTGVRRAVRAAAIYGQTFFRGGLATILGLTPSDPALDNCLSTLIDAELIQAQAKSGLANEKEYCFRHALVRDAAYGLLTAEDLSTGHRLAAEFLEAAGERDAAVIADHFERSGERARAVGWYVRAAENDHARGNTRSALQHVERGLRCGAVGTQRGVLRSIESRIAVFMNRFDAIEESAAVALSALKQGSHYWTRALLSALLDALRRQSSARTSELVSLLLKTEPEAAAYSSYSDCLAAACATFAITNAPVSLLQTILHRLSTINVQAQNNNSAIQRSLSICRATMLIYRFAGPFTLMKEAQRAISLSDEAGDVTQLEYLRGTLIEWGFLDLGDDEGARDRLSAIASAMDHNPNLGLVSLYQHLLARALCRSNDEDAWARAEKLVTPMVTQTGSFVSQPSLARGVLGRVALLRGRNEEAEAQARAAMELFPKLPGWLSHVAPVQIHALLALKKFDTATEISHQVLRVAETLGGFGVAEVELRLAASLAFHAAGDLARAHDELRETLRQVKLRADDISDPFWKNSYLHRNPHCVRTQALAKEWGLAANEDLELIA